MTFPELAEQTPEQLIAYIKKLRQENQQTREDAAPFIQAFSKLQENDRRVMLRAIEAFGTDPEQGAMTFRRIADYVLPEETPTMSQQQPINNGNGQIPFPQPQQQTPQQVAPQQPAQSNNTELNQVLAAVQSLSETVGQMNNRIDAQEKAAKEAAEAANRQSIVDQANKLGYTEGSPEWEGMMAYAVPLGSLELGDQLYRQLNPDFGKKGEEPAQQDPAAALAPNAIPAPTAVPATTPPNPGGTGSPAVVQAAGTGQPPPNVGAAPPDNSLSTAHQRAEAMLTNMFAQP